MTDIVSRETRSRMMSGIRGKNTKPEKIVRTGLHRKGFRFRLHIQSLPGKPDIVLKRHNAVIFVHGCFWHKHDCHYFKWPKTRSSFWKKKILKNVSNDMSNITRLLLDGWRVSIVWECSLRGKEPEPVIDRLVVWLLSTDDFMEVAD